ncbi:hypothetical protein HAX54_042738 [Datura stramonium]|uniref:Putative plant transposon protein domain-containing protein n=1 Tax=Datura stramonium TaxID=4076 RepID=A0ABS8W1D3_DATST|nr:hypothetical protein [Datura stramonium]
MEPQFQPTRGGLRRRIDKPDLANCLKDEPTYSKEEVKFSEKNIFKKALPPQEKDISGGVLQKKWMSEAPSLYFSNMVFEFYANYAATLDIMCKKGQKASEIPILTRVQIHGVPVDISANTINMMLYGQEFTPRARTIKFDYKMRERHSQRPWFSQVLTDGQPSWIASSKKRINKSSLIFAVLFWWVVVRLQLLPSGGDHSLGEDRAMLVAILMLGFPFNMGVIIEDKTHN